MLAWLTTTFQEDPDRSGHVDSAWTKEGRDEKCPAAGFDVTVRRAMQGTAMAALTLKQKSDLSPTECARLIQMMQEATSNEIMRQSSEPDALLPWPEVFNALNAFVVRLHFAERLTEAVAGIGSAEESDASHRPLLNDAWTRAATAAKRLVDTLKCNAAMDERRRSFFEIISTSFGLIQSHLDSADEQLPSLFPLADRRTHRRTLLGIWVRMATSSTVGDAFLNDISASGFGIATPLAIKPGSTVEIEVPDGRILEARVVWVQGTRAGARFLKPLDLKDKLITTNVTSMRLSDQMPAEPLNAHQRSQQVKSKLRE